MAKLMCAATQKGQKLFIEYVHQNLYLNAMQSLLVLRFLWIDVNVSFSGWNTKIHGS